MKRGGLAAAVIILVLIIDQVLKIWVKTHFYLGEDFEITSWFYLHFIENNGMAFGMELGSKIFLTIFRIVVVAALIYYLLKIRSRREFPTGYLIMIALVIAGAAGNIIDCMFYGVIFNDPFPPQVATMFPATGGYAPVMMGRVVDMLYFPIFSFDWPGWMPIVGGEHFIFFQPVFNFADAAISVGMIAIILFYSRYITLYFDKKPVKDETEQH